MKRSLRIKTALMIVMIAVVLNATGMIVSNRFITGIVDENYKEKAKDLAETASVVIDTERAAALRDSVLAIYNTAEERVSSEDWGSEAFDAYVALFADVERTEEFEQLRRMLRGVQDVNDVDCLYLIAVDAENENFIYLVDSAYEDACPPGCFDPIFEENRPVLTDPSRGFPPYITDTETYGKLVTAGVPVYGENGEIVCYAMADISMEVIRAQQNSFMLSLSGLLTLVTVLICAVAIWVVNRTIIRPINQLSHAVAHYGSGSEDSSNSELDALTIKTQDEIETLYNAIKQMLHDINGYIDNLKQTTKELKRTRLRASEMDELAHRDALTGVGSKLAYEKKVGELTEKMEDGTARYAIVMVDLNGLKKLNDTYGHEKGDIAIRNVCDRVCAVFTRSQVYRFGGDEFVVVVEGEDYDSVESLTAELEDDLAPSEGEPWEAVTAAVGCACYDAPTDDVVEDVFRRADRIMYEQKKEMKAERRA